MKSLSKQFLEVSRLKSSTLTLVPSFYMYKDDRWESIKESEFFNALYTNLFEKDEDASSPQQTVYKRK